MIGMVWIPVILSYKVDNNLDAGYLRPMSGSILIRKAMIRCWQCGGPYGGTCGLGNSQVVVVADMLR